MAEVGKRVTERDLVTRREGKYDLWGSLFDKNVFFLFLESMK